jgi:hypothetical protein
MRGLLISFISSCEKNHIFFFQINYIMNIFCKYYSLKLVNAFIITKLDVNMFLFYGMQIHLYNMVRLNFGELII